MRELKNIEQKIENQFEVLKRIDNYIVTTNTKCTIIMSYCAAATALIITLLPNLDFSTLITPSLIATGLFSILALVLALWCLILATLTIFPVTFSKPGLQNGHSLIFYGDISLISTGAHYSQKVKDASNEDFLQDLNEQVYTLASIATSKFSKIKMITVILMLHFGCMIGVLIFTIFYFLL